MSNTKERKLCLCFLYEQRIQLYGKLGIVWAAGNEMYKKCGHFGSFCNKYCVVQRVIVFSFTSQGSLYIKFTENELSYKIMC